MLPDSSASASAALRVLALGPNPALQRVLSFPSPLALGAVNRASSVSEYVGGKGQGVALAVARWAPGCAAAAQFVGGDTGQFVDARLRAQGVDTISQPTAAPTRVCTTLIDAGVTTELIDPSGPVDEAEVAGLLHALGGRLGEFGAVALCGTTPPGGGSLYARLARRLGDASPAETGRPGPEPILLLDGYKEVGEVLCSGRVDVLKVNVEEALALTGTTSPHAAADKLLRVQGAPLSRRGALLALTNGPDPALLFSREGSWQLQVPALACVNAIGAGDVCTGIFLHHLAAAAADDADGRVAPAAALDAFAWGLAAACARCTREQPDFARAEVEAFRAQVECSEWMELGEAHVEYM